MHLQIPAEALVRRLHLVVARHDGRIARWRLPVAPLAIVRPRLLLLRRSVAVVIVRRGAIRHMPLLWRLRVARASVDEDVLHATVLTLGDRVVFEGWLGVFGDDVPCMQEAGDLRGRLVWVRPGRVRETYVA